MQNLRLFDTHCHFETEDAQTIASTLARARAAGVVRQTLKSDDLAERLLESGEMMYQVNIELLRSPQDPSLYDWSFGQPADVNMNIGTYCSVLSETRRRSMFRYLFERSRTRFRSVKLRTE